MFLLCGFLGFLRHSFFFGIIHIKFVTKAITCNGFLQNNLEVVSVVIVEEPCTNNKPCMVINYMEQVCFPLCPVFNNINAMTGICLVHVAWKFLFKSLSILYVWFSSRL